MQGAKTILVPVDFQEASLAALEVARDLASKLGLEIVLLHVFSIPVVVYPGFDPIIAPGLPEQIAATAKDALDQLAQTSGCSRTILRAGDPATETLKVVDELHPAYVTMGTHGRKGLAHLFIGSIAEQVVRSCPVPVITVHAAHK